MPPLLCGLLALLLEVSLNLLHIGPVGAIQDKNDYDIDKHHADQHGKEDRLKTELLPQEASQQIVDRPAN